MGKFTNMLGAQITGNVGAVNFRMVDGEMVAAKRSYTNSSKGDGASYAQRLHRVRMPNIATLFHQILLIERRGWENKKANQSDFNMFTRANLASSPVFLTKQEADLGAAVIAPYAVSRGNLSQIQAKFTDDTEVGLNINLGTLSVDDWDTLTIGQFSERVVNNNPNWQEGDKLSVCRLVQIERTISGITIPQVEVTYFEITLDFNSTTVFIDIPNFGTLQPDASNPDAQGNRWLHFQDGGDGFFAIHSRESAGYLECSSEDLAVKNLFSEFYINHTSDAAKVAAMDSYGYKDLVLLDPNSEDAISIESQAFVNNCYASSPSGNYPIYDGAVVGNSTANVNISGGNFTSDNVKLQKAISNNPWVWSAVTPNMPLNSNSRSWSISLQSASPAIYRILVDNKEFAQFTQVSV